MKFRIGALIALLFVCCGLKADEKEPGSELIAPFEKTDHSMRELVGFLQSEGAALNFEEVPIRVEDGISYRNVLDEMSKRDPESLTRREKEWLEMAGEAKKQTDSGEKPGELDLIFHYHEERFDLAIKKPTPLIDVLKAAISKDRRYRLWKGKTRFAVVPDENDYREKNILILRPMPVGEAIFKLGRDVTEPNGFDHAMIASGKGKESYLTTKKVISVSIVEAPVYEVMDTFAAEMSRVMKRDFVWVIGGYYGSRRFSFVERD